MKLRSSLFSAVLVMTFAMVVWGQACTSNVGFIGLSGPSSSSSESSSSSQPSLGSPTTDGNGNTYDGKIRVVHHYSDAGRYWCNDHEVPESVLYRLDESTNEWYYIQNYKESCQSAVAVKVTGVTFNEALVVASYSGKEFVRPKDITVNPLEDPNLSDKNLFDSVCADINNKCSLRAAIEQANFILLTSDIKVNVLSGIYKLIKPLELEMMSPRKLSIVGENNASSVLDGQLLTNHFNIKNIGGQLSIEKLSFINGVTRPTEVSPFNQASSIVDASSGQKTYISDCIFKNNDSSRYVVRTESSQLLKISRSKFFNNTSSTIAGSVIRTFGTALVVEDSSINDNIGIGVNVENQTYNVKINSSAIFNNSLIGIYFMLCRQCEINNTTIANNGIGVSLNTMNLGGLGSDYNVVINNSTIVDNSKLGTWGNINFGFFSPSTNLILNNSIVAVHSPTVNNCSAGGAGMYSNYGLQATNSLFNDSSCSVTGVGNLFGVDPNLGVLSDNGGLTPSMMPAAISPVIDAGDNLSCLALDQRGQGRPVNKLGLPVATCDMGAVELQ